MITWIQQTFQQHFRTMFIALLAAIIISFVFITNASNGFGSGGVKRETKPFFDRNLATASDANAIFGDALQSVRLSSNPAPYRVQSQADLEDYAKQRYAGLHLANQLHVPAPSQSEIAEHVRGLRAFAGPDGQFDAKTYASFRDSLKASAQFTEADVARVLSDDIRFARVQKLLSGPGYVLPADIAKQLVRADTNWTLGVATIDATAFKPEVAAPDAAVAKFFEENAVRYTIPPQISVDAIEFPATAFAAQVTVTEAEVRAFYDANPARFPKPAQTSAVPNALAANPVAAGAASADADFAAVRPQVEAALRLQQAQALAARAASDLTVVLHGEKTTLEKLPATLASRGLTTKSVPPFSQENPPAGLGGYETVSEAFKLGADRPFSSAVATDTGAAVLVYKNLIPSRQPSLAEVKARVVADYQNAEKEKLFTQFAKSIRSAVETRLKAGEPFEKAVASAASALNAKVEAKVLPSFTLRAPPAGAPYGALNAIDSLAKGGLTDVINEGDKGLFVYVQDKVLPDVSPTSPGFLAMQKLLADFTAGQNASEYLRQLVAAEEAKFVTSSTPPPPAR